MGKKSIFSNYFSDPSVRFLGEELARKGAKADEIHDKLLNPEDPTLSISNPAMAHNIVQAVRQLESKFPPMATIQDAVAQVQKMGITTHMDWIHDIHWHHGEPSFTLYTTETMMDLAVGSLAERPLIIGIDRTFEMCSMFCTFITYRFL